jgi:uncharacterized protein YmfQ (DUF2313 family)
MAVVHFGAGLLAHSRFGASLSVALPSYSGHLSVSGRALQSFLPPGIAWSREEAADLSALIDGLAAEFGRVEQRLADVENEFLPDRATELIGEWAATVGFPGELPDDLALQRLLLCKKLTAVARQDNAYWIALGLTLGYTLTIHEYRPFVAGSPCGAPMTQSPWIHRWDIHTAHGAHDALLEALIRLLANEHTLVRFFYDA